MHHHGRKMQTRQINVTLLEQDSSCAPQQKCNELLKKYDGCRQTKRMEGSTDLQLLEQIGQGGQGTVFLAEQNGADGFSLPVAVKIFSPEPYTHPDDYDQDMLRIGHVAAKVARLDSENLLNVLHFLDRDRIRVMIMEWIAGFDLRRLLTPRMLGVVQDRVSEKRWNFITENLVSIGKVQPRMNACQAIHIVRDCLVGLDTLHEHGLFHGDIKPANIMLKRNGRAKIVDIGNASDQEYPARIRACTPMYCSPQILRGNPPSNASDLVSLGYVLLEMVSGEPVFSRTENLQQLIQEKHDIRNSFTAIVPEDTPQFEQLCEIIHALITADPLCDAPNNWQANSAACVIKQIDDLNLTTQSPNELEIWVQELLEFPWTETDHLPG